MPIDPNIALQVRPLEVPNQLGQLAQVSQIQAAQRQGEVAQMQLEQLKQDRDEMVKLQQELVAKGGSPDLRTLAASLLKSPKHVMQGIELLQKLDEQDKYEAFQKQRFGGGAAPAGAATPAAAPAAAPAPAVSGALGSGTFGITPAPTNALAPAPAAAPAPAPTNALISQQKTPQQIEAEIAGLSRFANRPGVKEEIAGLYQQLTELRKPIIAAPGSTIYGAGGNVIANVPAQPTELQRNYEFAKRQGFPGSIFDYEREIKIAGRQPATPATPAAPVAVVGEDGKVRYVSREEAIGKGMTPAAAFEGITPKEIQKREAALPAATSAVKGFETKSDSFLKDLKALRDHPGLSEITGFVAGRLPGLTADGRAAQALYDKVVAKGGFQALQDLRDASKTGGALGNVSNQEGKQLTASFAAIDRRQDAKDVQAALDTAIADVQGARTRMREAYDDTYRYKSERGGAAPAKAAPDPLGIR